MRRVADCRELPSDAGCSLTISGEEEEVVRAAAEHAASVHGHDDTADLREQIRSGLVDEGAAGRYGTVMIAKLSGSLDAVRQAAVDWAQQRRVAGFLAEELLLSDDGQTVVVPVFFDSKDSYQRLADDPEQDRWWRERFAPHLEDVRWIDGTWQRTVARSAPPQRMPVQSGRTQG